MPCHASLPASGEAGEETLGRAMGTGVWAGQWPWGYGVSWLPQVPFRCLSRAIVSGALMRRLQGPWVGALTPACGPGMWTHSPERHSLFTRDGALLGRPTLAQPHPLVEEFALLLTDVVLIIPLRTVCNHRAVNPGSAKGRSRVTCAD